MKMPFQFDSRISAGNVITILGGVVVLIVGWTTMQSDIRQQRDATLEMRARIERLEGKDEILLKQVNDGQRDNAAALAELKAQMTILLQRQAATRP